MKSLSVFALPEVAVDRADDCTGGTQTSHVSHPLVRWWRGIRGLVSLAILKRLQAETPDIVSHADLLAGTSTGGIIALALAAGHSIDDLVALYPRSSEDLMPYPLRRRVHVDGTANSKA